MNRDDGQDPKPKKGGKPKKGAEESAPPSKMVANPADVSMSKRVAITKVAKRFERYGHVADARQLGELVAPVARLVEDMPDEVTADVARGK